MQCVSLSYLTSAGMCTCGDSDFVQMLVSELTATLTRGQTLR